MNDDAQLQQQPMTLADMEARRDEIEMSIASLRAKIDNVVARKHLTGEYADPDWYRRAKTKLRFFGVEHQKLLRQIAEAKRAERQDRGVRVERAFVEAAREHLPAHMFDELMAKARTTAAVAD